jgi:hypothetical protein
VNVDLCMPRIGGALIVHFEVGDEGAIDNRPTPDPEDVKGAENYISDALLASMGGKTVNPA